MCSKRVKYIVGASKEALYHLWQCLWSLLHQVGVLKLY